MSSRSSPARSGAGSVTPSPSSTQENTLPDQLTPRSKIKAMLAAVDDESDQESDPVPQRPTLKHADNTERRHTRGPGSSGRESESSLDEPIKARGKLAARLQRQGPIGKASDGDSTAAREDREEEDPGNAYERVKRKLVLKETPTEGNQDRLSPNKESVHDDDDEPILPRRLPRADSEDPSTTLEAPEATPLRSRRSSPGLFLTSEASEGRSPIKPAANDDSDSELPADPRTNERFLALVARKREEREAREAAEAKKRAAREAQYKQQTKKGLSRRSTTPLGDSEEDSDDVGARKLTQQARPTRKASKRALEEMNRETQRMNRNMQLAHQARTKKKITKESLFARFNFRTANTANELNQQAQSSSTGLSSAPVSETEGVQHQETPPTSPVAPQDPSKRLATETAEAGPSEHSPHQAPIEEDELPTIEDVFHEPRPVLMKGKAIAIESTADEMMQAPEEPRTKIKRPSLKIRFSKAHTTSNNQPDSESDLEILPARKIRVSKLDVFQRVSAENPSEARSLQTLRALAHLNSPEKRSSKSRSSMTLSDMQQSLQQRARLQAAAEREEKIQDLKDRGIIVQTAEERQKDQAAVEDLVEKARQEAADIKTKEKNAAKRAAKWKGEEFNDSSDDDEDYQANEADESEIDLSGSEEENVIAEGSDDELGEKADAEDDDEEGGVNLDEAKHSNDLVEDEAMEDAEDEECSEAGEKAGDEVDSESDEKPPPQHRKSRANRTIEDEDEEPSNSEPTQHLFPVLETPQKPMIPAIGLGTSPGLLGMTQAFAATLAESQTQANGGFEMDAEQDSMDFLGVVPEPNIPLFDTNDAESMIPDSQADNAKDTNISGINLDYDQSQIDYNPSQDPQESPTATQDYEIPDPTQDMGFHLSSPAGNRFVSVPPSTVETVLLPEDSPIRRKKGRLQRGRKESVGLSDAAEEVPVSPQQPAEFDVSANAFDVMKKKRKAAVATSVFDKKKSNAKDMVEEQAQESDDEYAGIGGASDDESGGEEDEDLKRMIEEGEVEVDERKLAAFYADKERASDEQAISKLYKDINNGGLRRKRGADFDLSDSDDDAEARQRAKRRDFAKMRKALLTDEKLGKIAEDPKKMAFLRAVEDREDEEDLGIGWDVLDKPEEKHEEESTQEVADSQTQPANTENTKTKRKRPLQESLPDAANRPPPAARRTKTKKPATLAEIRESVSFLIETPESTSFQSHASSSSDIDSDSENPTSPPAIQPPHRNNEEEQDNSNSTKDLMPPPPLPRPHQNPRRTPAAPIIDRLSLKRASTTDTHSTTRLAFAAPMTSQHTTFHVPSLLRRASTSNLAPVDKSHGITTFAATEQAAGGGDAMGKGAYVKRGGRKGSSILGQAREVERRAVVEGVERRRVEERERVAGLRREGFLGRGGGSWEV